MSEVLRTYYVYIMHFVITSSWTVHVSDQSCHMREVMADNDKSDKYVFSSTEFLLHSLHCVPLLVSPCLTPQGGRLQTEEDVKEMSPSTYMCTHTHHTPIHHHSTPSRLAEKSLHRHNYTFHKTRPLTVSCSAWNGEQIAPNLCVDLRSISE